MRKIFECKVLEVGEEAKEYLKYDAFVLFSKVALDSFGSEELESICFKHDFPKVPYFNVKPGHTLYIDDKAFPIEKVGDAANHNLKNYGHVTIKAAGDHPDSYFKPGDIVIRKTGEIKVDIGTVIRVVSD